MNPHFNPIEQMIHKAITDGSALTIQQIRAQRELSRRAVRQGKAIFWVAIALLNLMVWVQLPIPGLVRVLIGLFALLTALVAPIVWSKKHQLNLLLLEKSDETPKRRKADEKVKTYIDQVREQGRPYIRAELEALERDKGKD